MLPRAGPWLTIYLALILVPLAMAVVGSRPRGRDFWTEFGIALGFVGLAMVVLQFLLTARIRALTRPFGIDAVLRFHRHAGLIALGLIVAHPVVLAWNLDNWRLLNPFDTSAAARNGLAAVLLLAVIAALSIWRLRFRLSYEAWHFTHGLLALAVLVFAYRHFTSTGLYIDGGWRAVAFTAMLLAAAGLLAYIRLVKPLLLMRRPFRLVSVREERGGSWSLELEPEGAHRMQFRPGQFAWVRIGTSPFTFDEHPFSFTSVPEVSDRIRFTVKELGDFTERVKELEPGTRAYVDGPYGVFTFKRFPAPGYVFIAGGIGITPFISMLQSLALEGDRRPILLVYANRALEEATHREELEALQARLNLRVVHVLEEPAEGWEGEQGFVTKELLANQLPQDRLEVQYFLCGPPVMNDAVRSALLALGIPLRRIQVEEFALV